MFRTTIQSAIELPSDNPFINAPSPTRKEIWDLGLRNPWRYSFDDVALGGTGALVIGDVGRTLSRRSTTSHAGEEVATTDGRDARVRTPTWIGRRRPRPLIDPIHDYGRTLGASVTGGFVYRGRSLGSQYRGRYFFADYFGRVWSLGLALDANGEARA